MFTIDIDLAGFDQGATKVAAFVEEDVVPDLVAAMGLQILRGAILRSRVLTGYYRMMHMLEINGYPSEILPKPPAGSVAMAPDLAQAAAKLGKLTKAQWIGFANNVAYAPVREWGSETQTPDLTVTRAVEAAVNWANGLGEIEGGLAGSAA